MAETPPVGETQTLPLNNNVTPPAPVIQPPVVTPAGNTDAQLAEAKKEAEQAKMRANQLENELKTKNDAEAAAKAKQLEDNQEFKTLYDQQKAENERIVAERDAADKKVTLEAEESKITAKYAPEVLDIVKELGAKLEDASPEAVAAYTAKLDKISEKIGAKNPVGPNNNPVNRNVQPDRAAQLKAYRETGDPRQMDALINNLSFVKPFIPQQ